MPTVSRTKVYWDAEKYADRSSILPTASITSRNDVYTTGVQTHSLCTTKSFGYGHSCISVDGTQTGSALYIMPPEMAETEYRTFSIWMHYTGSAPPYTIGLVNNRTTFATTIVTPVKGAETSGNWKRWDAGTTTSGTYYGVRIRHSGSAAFADDLFIDFLHARPTASTTKLLYTTPTYNFNVGLSPGTHNTPNFGGFGTMDVELSSKVFGDPSATIAFIDGTPPQELLITDDFFTGSILPTSRRLNYPEGKINTYVNLTVTGRRVVGR